jgi:hypothetical protein
LVWPMKNVKAISIIFPDAVGVISKVPSPTGWLRLVQASAVPLEASSLNWKNFLCSNDEDIVPNSNAVAPLLTLKTCLA